MASTNKKAIDLKSFYEKVPAFATALKTVLDKNDALFEQIKKSTYGEGGTCDWSGGKARQWYRASVRNVVNNYYWIAQMACIMAQKCDLAATNAFNEKAGTGKNSSDATTYKKYYDTITKAQNIFVNILKRANEGATPVKNWAYQ